MGQTSVSAHWWWQGLQACFQLLFGRAALMSDPCWRLLPLQLKGAPHILWPRAACPAWPPLGPCQPLQS